MKFAMKLLTFFVAYAASGLWSPVASSRDVQLTVDWSTKSWVGYPGSIGKISSEWKDKKLYVHVVVTWQPGVEIRSENSRAVARGSKLHLCYRPTVDPNLIGKPVPAAFRPVLLEFVITGIPKRNYQIDVTDRCYES